MRMELRLRKLELILEYGVGGEKLRTICFLCDGDMPTPVQKEAAFNDYKLIHHDWDTEDLIEIMVRTGEAINEHN